MLVAPPPVQGGAAAGLPDAGQPAGGARQQVEAGRGLRQQAQGATNEDISNIIFIIFYYFIY